MMRRPNSEEEDYQRSFRDRNFRPLSMKSRPAIKSMPASVILLFRLLRRRHTVVHEAKTYTVILTRFRWKLIVRIRLTTTFKRNGQTEAFGRPTKRVCWVRSRHSSVPLASTEAIFSIFIVASVYEKVMLRKDEQTRRQIAPTKSIEKFETTTTDLRERERLEERIVDRPPLHRHPKNCKAKLHLQDSSVARSVVCFGIGCK